MISNTSWTPFKGQGSWYQCDLGRVFHVRGIISRGSHNQDAWVTKLSVHASLDGISWILKTDKVRDANYDRNTPIVTLLDNDSKRSNMNTKNIETTKTEWFVKKSYDSFAGKDAYVMKRVSRSGGVTAMRKLALKRGYGGFVCNSSIHHITHSR